MRDTASLFSFARQYSNTEGSTARRFAAEKGDGVKVNLNKEQQAMLDGEKAAHLRAGARHGGHGIPLRPRGG